VARKQFSNEFKAKVALEALKGEKTIAQLSSEYGVHASQINTWKQQAREKLPELFGRSSGLDEQRREAEQDRLYQQIGRLQVEVDWLRKKSKALGLT
jgi:transposase-like protein